MECPNCKAQNRDGVRFCSNCGQRMPPDATVLGASAIPPTVAAVPGVRGSSLAIGTPLQGGRYVIKEVLGQGGMGAALLATDKRLDSKLVVIKELISDSNDSTRLKEDEANFKREVVTLAHLDHPLIPNVTDNFDENSRFFMVQEYVEGETLEDRVDRLNQALNERDALIYASEILDVLDYLSQQTPPIIHRDIKPANIIISTKDKKAHLVDFGIARADAARNAKRKQTSALGTPGYAPPEQYQGNADPRSDLYALGATLHHLLTNRDPRGHQPFSYPPARTLNAQLSPDVESVLTRALLNDINQRYQSASAMKGDVDQILYQRFGIASGALSGYTSSGTMADVTMPGSGASLIGSSALAPGVNPGAPTVQGAPTFAQSSYHGTPYTPLPPVGTGPTIAPPPPSMANMANPPMPGPPTPPYLYQPSQPMPQVFPPVQGQPRKRNPLLVVGLVVLLLLLLGGGILGWLRLRGGENGPSSTATGTPGIYVTPVKSGEQIGISDGSFAFDTSRPDGSLKTQAAAALRAGNVSQAMGFWQQAVAMEPNDPEAQIYLENQKVLAAGGFHVTIVVATMLTGSNVGVGRDDLQGAYVAQKTYNDGSLLNGINVVLLIANGSSESANAQTVAHQIVQAAQADTSIVGVMGWPYSSYAANTVSIFKAAKLPVVSQTASSDLLSGVSPYFFRVCASNKSQGIAGARYIERALSANRVIVFTDPLNAYTSSLGKDFADQYQADGRTILTTEKYTVGKATTITSALQDAISKYSSPAPDVIYFSGYASDISTLMTDLPTSGPWGNVKIMGGDALYELSGYQTSSRITWTRLHFTTFTYPDVWEALGLAAQKPPFFANYANDFNPNNFHAPGYGWTRPDNDVILSYDALTAILVAVKATGKSQLTPADLETALTQMKGKNAFQGVSGQIAFGPDGNPINKAVVILFVSPKGFIMIDGGATQGQFLL